MHSTPEAASVAKILRKASRRHSELDAFRALVDLMFCAYAKPTTQGKERKEALEAQYMRQVGRWPKEDVREIFPKAAGELALAYGNPGTCQDYLGQIAGELGILSSDLGQFFTPIEMCKLMAGVTLEDMNTHVKRRGFITVQEPAAGAGAMILACADHVRRQGLDPTTTLWVDATELHYPTYQMCFLALTLSGVAGVVRNGNSLSMETFESTPTMGAVPFLQKHGSSWERPKPRVRVRRRKPKPQPRVRVRKNVQK